ncbi:hypothetical protein M1N19_03810 [Dehalococcoidia bacterium]|nr:hypothetical protein [Dehalococcoidia bacterium]
MMGWFFGSGGEEEREVLELRDKLCVKQSRNERQTGKKGKRVPLVS